MLVFLQLLELHLKVVIEERLQETQLLQLSSRLIRNNQSWSNKRTTYSC